jgi:hypothetical protein
MLKFLRNLLVPIMIITFSCEKTGLIVNCSDCLPDEPTTANLTADLDGKYYSTALIQIWEGNLEDSLLVGNFTVSGTTFEHEVVLNKKYTVTATYNVNEKRVTAVDSATPRVRYEKSQCDNACYFIYDRKCNLKLNYHP